MIARIYGRFSSKPQERGDSKRRQVDGATDYAKKHGHTIAGVYFDESVSGKAGANLEKEFGRLLKEANPGEIILVEALDRIGRQNPFILGKLLYDTVQRDITVIAWQEGKTVTKQNIENLDTQFSVFTGAAVGHADNKRKIDRLIETTQNAFIQAERGSQSGTLVKYLPECFRWNEQANKIEIDDDKAEPVQNIFRWYADGLGKTVIAQKLNTAGYQTPYTKRQNGPGKAKPWLETSIKKILKNESYAGVLNVRGHRLTCIPKVVDRDLFDEVQLLLKRHSQRHGRLNGRVNNLFRGLAVCKHCGGTVNVNVTLPKKPHLRTFYSYRCKNARLKLCKHPHKMLNGRLVELNFFAEYFGGSPETTFATRNTQLQKEIQAKQTRIEKLNEAMGNLYDLAEQGDEEAKHRIAKRKTERDNLTSELVTLKGSLVQEEYLPTLLDEIDDLFGTPEARALMRSFYTRIEAKLADDTTRTRLVNALPMLFSKVEFDCIAKTLRAFRKDGTPLKVVDVSCLGETE